MGQISFTNDAGNTVNISFKVGIQGETFKPMALDRNVNRDGNGGAEIILGSLDWELNIPTLFISEDQYNKFMGWFSYAIRGVPFSVAMDTSNVANTTLSAAGGCSESNPNNLQVTSATGISTGDRLFVRSANRFYYEDIKVANLVSTTITTDWGLMNDYDSGDTIRHYRYFPSMFLDDLQELNAGRTNALDLTAEGYRRFSLKCKEKF